MVHEAESSIPSLVQIMETKHGAGHGVQRTYIAGGKGTVGRHKGPAGDVLCSMLLERHASTRWLLYCFAPFLTRI